MPKTIIDANRDVEVPQVPDINHTFNRLKHETHILYKSGRNERSRARGSLVYPTTRMTRTSTPTVETMTLKCENPMVEIDENNLNAPALTFTWKRRPPSARGVCAYLQGRTRRARQQLRHKTVITSGVGFDHLRQRYRPILGHIHQRAAQQLVQDRWALPANKNFTLEFRVMAQWNGGSEFEAPEVRKVSAEVKADTDNHLRLRQDDARRQCHSRNNRYQQDSRKRECLRLEEGALTAGELQIPIEFDGLTYYLRNTDGSTNIADGTAMAVEMTETKRVRGTSCRRRLPHRSQHDRKECHHLLGRPPT